MTEIISRAVSVNCDDIRIRHEYKMEARLVSVVDVALLDLGVNCTLRTDR